MRILQCSTVGTQEALDSMEGQFRFTFFVFLLCYEKALSCKTSDDPMNGKRLKTQDVEQFYTVISRFWVWLARDNNSLSTELARSLFRLHVHVRSSPSHQIWRYNACYQQACRQGALWQPMRKWWKFLDFAQWRSWRGYHRYIMWNRVWKILH